MSNVLWTRQSSNDLAVDVVSQAKNQIDRSRSIGQEVRSLVADSLNAIHRSRDLLGRCQTSLRKRALEFSEVTCPPCLSRVVIEVQGIRYEGWYAVAPSGHPEGCFVTVYSEVGEHAAWVRGIDAGVAAEMIFAKLVVAGKLSGDH